MALSLALLAVARPAAAQDAPAPPRSGFRADYLMELDRLRSRMLALAREVPAERYAARPGPEIHSIAECLGDLAAASRRTLGGMEREVPGAAEERGPAAGKAGVVEELTAVLDAARRAALKTPDEGLEAPWDYLGRRWTTRALFLLLLSQMHEGMGHAAAHAESLGILPPWLRLKRVSEAHDD